MRKERLHQAGGTDAGRRVAGSSPSSSGFPREDFRPALERELMEAGCVNEQTGDLDASLRRRIVGQEAAVDTLVCSFSRVLAGLRDPDRPVLSLLLLGPTGVGKTETARALANALFGSDHALTRVECEEYAHGHELSKLLGSPPGYVGHDVEPLLSQRRIDLPHRLAASGGSS